LAASRSPTAFPIRPRRRSESKLTFVTVVKRASTTKRSIP